MPISDTGEFIDRIPSTQPIEPRHLAIEGGDTSASSLVPNLNLWRSPGPHILNGYIDKSITEKTRVLRRPGLDIFAKYNKFVETVSDHTGAHTFWDSTGHTTLMFSDEKLLMIDPTPPIHCGVEGFFQRNFGHFSGFFGPVGLVGLPSSTSGATTAWKFSGTGTDNDYRPTGTRFLVASNTGGHKSVWSVSDAGTFTLLTSAPAWAARTDFWLIGDGGFVYLMGGQDGSGTHFNDVWRSSDGITWTQQTSAAGWAVRRNARSVVLGNSGNLLVIGGRNSGGFFNDVWSSTNGGVSWSMLTAAAGFTARELFACNKLELWEGRPANELVVSGGFAATGEIKDDTFWTSSDGITWTARVLTKDTSVPFASPGARSIYPVPDTSFYTAPGYGDLYPVCGFALPTSGTSRTWFHVWKKGGMMAVLDTVFNVGANQGEIIQMSTSVASYMVGLSATTSQGGNLIPIFSGRHSLIRDRFSLEA